MGLRRWAVRCCSHRYRGGPVVRSVLRAIALVVATALLLVVSAGPASAARYVGLGDSAASGPLIPNQIPAPLGCWRSDHNFAHIAAQSLGVSLKDVSCSGARTDHMSSPQDVYLGPNPPQFDALIAATAPKVAAVLQGIHARSERARVLVVGYAAILPHTGYGCWPQVAIAWEDVPYLRATHEALNAMLREQAAANNATYVDAYSASVGRDACRSYLVRWVEPTVPLNPAAPLHPNARGMRGVAAAVLGALGN